MIPVFFLTGCSTPKFDKDTKNFTTPFDGEKFENLEQFPDKSILDLLEWQFKSASNSVKWPEYSKAPQFKADAQRSEETIITVINHATVLIQTSNINILTDPHYSQRASPVSFAGPARVVPPAIAFEDLPPIDVVLISHNHYDHLDLPTLKMLDKDHSPIFMAGLGTKDFLASNGINGSIDMDWWESKTIEEIEIVFVPAQHWSARGLFDKREMLWGDYYIKGNHSVYFAGDTNLN